MNPSYKIVTSGKQLETQCLNGIDLLFYGYSTHAFIYDHVLCEEKLLESLEKTLSLYPYLAGRVINIQSDNPIMTACDSGVVFCVESYEEEFNYYSCVGGHLDNSYIKFNNDVFDKYTPLLLVKLSKYKNGSILGVSFYHTICDGVSFFQFMKNWGKVARREKPNLSDFIRRAMRDLAKHCDLSSVGEIPIAKIDSSTFPNLNQKDISVATFRLKLKTIQGLLESEAKENAAFHSGLRYTIWQAYITKLIIAHQISDSDSVSVTMVYNIRSLLGLNPYYFGNALAYPHFQMEREQFDQMSIGLIAEKLLKLRDNVAANKNMLYKDIYFWEKTKLEKQTRNYIYLSCVLSGNGGVYFNTSTKQPVYRIDFGSGAPVWYETPHRGLAYRNVRAFPAPENNGDIILYITLPKAELTELSKYLDKVPGS